MLPQLNLINYYHNIFVKYARIKVVINYPFSAIKVVTNRLKSAIKVVTNNKKSINYYLNSRSMWIRIKLKKKESSE